LGKEEKHEINHVDSEEKWNLYRSSAENDSRPAARREGKVDQTIAWLRGVISLRVGDGAEEKKEKGRSLCAGGHVSEKGIEQ